MPPTLEAPYNYLAELLEFSPQFRLRAHGIGPPRRPHHSNSRRCLICKVRSLPGFGIERAFLTGHLKARFAGITVDSIDRAALGRAQYGHSRVPRGLTTGNSTQKVQPRLKIRRRPS